MTNEGPQTCNISLAHRRQAGNGAPRTISFAFVGAIMAKKSSEYVGGVICGTLIGAHSHNEWLWTRSTKAWPQN